jgi:electron-transferring-flavoprotein dehydrogenase
VEGGAGPAGLAAAIRLKQKAPDISIVVVEKGSEVGAHILSGAFIDPIGVDSLLPGWRDEPSPIQQPVVEDRFLWMTANRARLRPPTIRAALGKCKAVALG